MTFFFTHKGKPFIYNAIQRKVDPKQRQRKPHLDKDRDKHTPTQNFSHHEEILLLLETKLILSLIIMSRSIGVLLFSRLYRGILLFLVDHWNRSIWAHLVGSIERIKYGFEDHPPCWTTQVPEKRGKYWSTTIFGSTLPMIYLVWSPEHCIYFR